MPEYLCDTVLPTEVIFTTIAVPVKNMSNYLIYEPNVANFALKKTVF